MKIVVNNIDEYNDVMGNYYNLSKYDDNSSDEILFQGYNTSRNDALKKLYSNYKKRAYINLESPTAFIGTTTNIEEQKYFTHVYNICPYTCEWANKKLETKFIPIPFPISLPTFENINSDNKQHDVIYMGTLINEGHYRVIDVMKKYNHIFTSLFNYPHRYKPTHVNIGSIDKWNLLANTKISICINQAQFKPNNIPNIKSYDGWETHKAFTNLESGVMPQMKSRITEAMGLRTLNLVKRDEWNIIEHWFEPNKHFIYWEDENDLNMKINEIINNFSKYQEIIDNAYEEVKKYDIDYIYENIINDGK